MLRLSELLDRIRPTGAPGAPSEGERQTRREHREAELASVLALLRVYEEEAHRSIAAARVEDDRLRARSRARAAAIRASLPDQIARVQDQSSRGAENRHQAELDRVRLETREEIVRLTHQADTEIPHLVGRAIDLILTYVSTPETAQ